MQNRVKRQNKGRRVKRGKLRKFEQVGMADNFHKKFHKSAILAAKPRRRGKITAPDNPYVGCMVSEYPRSYVVHVPNRRRLTDTRQAMRIAANLVVPGIGFMFAKSADNAVIIRKLQVLWG